MAQVKLLSVFLLLPVLLHSAVREAALKVSIIFSSQPKQVQSLRSSMRGHRMLLGVRSSAPMLTLGSDTNP